jgi:hypothetical protein
MRAFVPAALAATLFAVTLPLHAQKLSPDDVAARLSGRWTINRSLSPAIGGPGRSGGAAYRPAILLQRGGGGGGAAAPSGSGDMTPAELAERTALRRLLQIAPELTIKATAEKVSFVDLRGEQTCAVDGRATPMDVPDVQISSKCRWDKQQLRQEFAATRGKVTKTWAVDDKDHLVIKARVEAIGQDVSEATAVFDRVRGPI